MEKITRPIGVFDSGVGGLTVVKSLLDKMPRESFIYFGDTANLPYGNKSEEQLFSYARNIISFLIQREVKAIIIACGTHSSVTLPVISGDYSLPLLGVVKAGARTAARVSRTGKIGVIATQATVSKLAYTGEVKSINPDYEIYEKACPRFVPLVEAGNLDGRETREAVAEYLEPLLRLGIDTLILGCTHYPFLAPLIQEFAGRNVTLVDPSCETITELQGILGRDGLLNKSDETGGREFYVSGNDESFYKVGKLLIGDTIQAVHKLALG
ncbi:MAG: glutamate racemase [Syntrophomonas sp.]